uniref:Putative secreted protein n=1 Tax=Ixodes ricinus TaxID=34613 RepID=A0A6B0UQN0_IXORI
MLPKAPCAPWLFRTGWLFSFPLTTIAVMASTSSRTPTGVPGSALLRTPLSSGGDAFWIVFLADGALPAWSGKEAPSPGDAGATPPSARLSSSNKRSSRLLSGNSRAVSSAIRDDARLLCSEDTSSP